MRHAAREPAHGLELLRLPQLGLEPRLRLLRPLLLGDVLAHDQHDRPPVAIGHARRLAHGEAAAVLPLLAQLPVEDLVGSCEAILEVA